MAREVPAGKAFIEFFLKDDKLNRDVRGMRRSLMRMRTIVTGVAASFAAIGVSAGAAAAAIIKMTNKAGDFAETVSKFEAVFGERSNVVRKWAEDTAEALNITRKEALSTLAGFQDLFVPIGIETGVAEDMSKTLTQLAVDLGSFNNLKTADVVRDLQAAMTGSSETMKKYGVIVDAAAVKQELLNRGLDPKEATNAEKAMARLDIIMRSTTAAQDDAIRTADSYNNRLKALNTQFQELQVDIGEKFLPLMKDIATVAGEGLEDLRDMINGLGDGFAGLPDEAVQMAKDGKWKEAGQLIGQQVKDGIREAIGPGLFDALAEFHARGGFGVSSLATTTHGQAMLGAAGSVTGAVAGSQAAFSAPTSFDVLSLMQAMEDAAKMIVSSQNRTTQAVEDQDVERFN